MLNPITVFKQIKALLAANKEIKKMKFSELQTSEGRMALLLNVAGVYSAIHGFIPPALAAKIAVASLAVYTVGRAIVKAAEAVAKLTATQKDDLIVAEAGRILDVVAGAAPSAPSVLPPQP